MAGELLVLGLTSDVVLPRETRTIAFDAADKKSLESLNKQPPAEVLALPIDLASELPNHVVGRIGVRAAVEAWEPAAIRLRGLERVRITALRNTYPPYAYDVETVEEPTPSAALGALLRRMSSSSTDVSADALAAAHHLARTSLSMSDLRDLLDSPAGDDSGAGDTSAQRVTQPEEQLVALDAAVRDGTIPEARRATLKTLVDALAKRLGSYGARSNRAVAGEIGELERTLAALPLPAAARTLADEQLSMLSDMPKASYDYASFLTQLQLLATLPWGPPAPQPPLDLDAMATRLDADHDGLKKPKARILEYLAVRSLGGHARSTVLCLMGPPGVGKTSLAQSIADGLGRKLVRVALGGVHDESEIRGHRRTFVAASCGRILGAMREAGRVDPIILLDEIDKIGAERGRSPSAALLEVLDPEQNHAFRDNFLGLPYDLSHALIIATGNDIDGINGPLRDRLEMLELDGYTTDEKLAIARRHLLKRAASRAGLPAPIALSDEQLSTVIEDYTNEPGVRDLERRLASLHRHRAVGLVRANGKLEEEENRAAACAKLRDGELREVLGVARKRGADRVEHPPPGIVHGLAVGGSGSGTVLLVEVLRSAKSATQLHLTGQQGEVMREAVRVALSRIAFEAPALGISEEDLASTFHVHLPEGAVKKEGPSAGIPIYLAIRSVLTNQVVAPDVAWTGEITLRGQVLAVGGVRAKVLAAARAKLRRVVIPAANLDDLADGPAPAGVGTGTGIEVTGVSTLEEVAAIAFASKVPG